MTSFRRRKHPQHQQIIAMRQLDSAAATGSAVGVTSSDSKMAAATENAAKMATKMATGKPTNMAIKMAAVPENASKLATKMATYKSTDINAKMAIKMETNSAAKMASKMATNKPTKMANKMVSMPKNTTKMAIKMVTNVPTKVVSKMAAADLDIPRKDRRPSFVDLRNVLSLDDFDAFCAQATSGGSIYGMLRKQIYLSGPAAGGQDKGKKMPPEKRVMLRQRSKSLIQRSVALSEEKSIIKLLCDYSETAKSKQRLLRDNRRHSEVTVSTE